MIVVILAGLGGIVLGLAGGYLALVYYLTKHRP